MASSGIAEQSADEPAVFELARLAATGDLPATQALLGQLAPSISRIVAGVVGVRHSELDDVIQQSLIAVSQALRGFRGECHPAGYASRIALRVALRYRKRHRLELSRQKLLGETLRDQVDAGSEPAVSDRRRQLLRELLDDLPEEQAESLALRVMLGWSLEEVARASGVPVNTVRSRVRLAKEALRRRIEAGPDLRDALEGEI